MSSLPTSVRKVIETHGQLITGVSTLGDSDDLYESGLSSHATVNVMLALEAEFEVEFPDSLLRRSSFQSIDSICQALQTLGVTDTP